MSSYYMNQLNQTNFKRPYDRDYAVVRKSSMKRVTIEIIYNSEICKEFCEVIKRDLTELEATNLLKKYRDL